MIYPLGSCTTEAYRQIVIGSIQRFSKAKRVLGEEGGFAVYVNGGGSLFGTRMFFVLVVGFALVLS